MFDATTLHELDVSCILVVEISCNIACVVICYFPRCVRESVPDACCASTFGDCALILETWWSACVKGKTALALQAVSVSPGKLPAHHAQATFYLVRGRSGAPKHVCACRRDNEETEAAANSIFA